MLLGILVFYSLLSICIRNLVDSTFVYTFFLYLILWMIFLLYSAQSNTIYKLVLKLIYFIPTSNPNIY